MTGSRPSRLHRWLIRLGRNTRGGTAVEYGLIIALVVIAMLTSLIGVSDLTHGLWGFVSSSVVNAR